MYICIAHIFVYKNKIINNRSKEMAKLKGLEFQMEELKGLVFPSPGDNLVRCVALCFTKPDGTPLFNTIKQMLNDAGISVTHRHDVEPWRDKERFRKTISIHYRDIGQVPERCGEDVYEKTEKYVMGEKGDKIIYFILEWWAPEGRVQESYDKIRNFVVGYRNPDKAHPKSIRWKLGEKGQDPKNMLKNLIHMSDSWETAYKEIMNFYSSYPEEREEILKDFT